MPTKDLNYKVKLLTISLISSVVIAIGSNDKIQVSAEVPIQKNMVDNTINFLRTYEEETQLVLPLFNISACSLIILNNGVQLVNHMKKK